MEYHILNDQELSFQDIMKRHLSGEKMVDKKISDIGGKNIFCKEIENQFGEPPENADDIEAAAVQVHSRI